MFLSFAILVICAGCVLFGLYAWYVTKHITIANDTIDKAGIVANTNTWWQWLNAKLIGWKTIILGWIAAMTQVVSLGLSSDLSPFKDLPWSLVFEEKIANWITFACALLIPITHAFGMKTAAEVPPVD